MNATVAEIAVAAREQATSLREVSAAGDQMDKVTQQNAAMVEADHGCCSEPDT